MEHEESILESNKDLANPQGEVATAACEPQNSSVQPWHVKQPSSTDTPSPKLLCATGPRTQAGKRRTRYNALKTKLFAKASLLDGESTTQREALRKGLWDEYHPETSSGMEDVEYLVALYWRRRRFAKAEDAVIGNIVNFRTYDSNYAPTVKASDVLRVKEPPRGMPKYSSKTSVLRDAIEMVQIFRDNLEKCGLRADEDPSFRTKLYELYHDDKGSRRLHHMEIVPSRYREQHEAENQLRQDQFLSEMLDVICEEIARLESLHDTELFASKEERQYSTIAALNPFRDVMDSIARVQAHTSREIERTQNRLQGARRIREGQPEPPTVRFKLDD